MFCSYCRAPLDVAGVLRVLATGNVETPPICYDREACIGRRFRALTLQPAVGGGFALCFTAKNGLALSPLFAMRSGSLS